MEVRLFKLVKTLLQFIKTSRLVKPFQNTIRTSQGSARIVKAQNSVETHLDFLKISQNFSMSNSCTPEF